MPLIDLRVKGSTRIEPSRVRPKGIEVDLEPKLGFREEEERYLRA
jgi:hypothetical protein